MRRTITTLLAAAIIASGGGLAANATGDTFGRFGDRWERVSPSLADALAEGSARNATTRNWENCAVRYGHGRVRVICPNGYSTSWTR